MLGSLIRCSLVLIDVRAPGERAEKGIIDYENQLATPWKTSSLRKLTGLQTKMLPS